MCNEGHHLLEVDSIRTTPQNTTETTERKVATMGTKDTRAAHGAQGKKDVLLFDPDDLFLVEDESHPLYQPSVHDEVPEETILNYMHYGVLQPITVRKNAETGKTEVVVGRTRTKGLRIANQRLRARGDKPHMMPAMAKRGDLELMAGVMVSENAIRRAYSPMQRASEMKKLADMNYSDDQIAMTFGLKSVTSVKSAMAVLDATKAVREAVDAGTVTFAQGAKLATLEPEEQRKKIEEIASIGAGKNKRNGTARQRAQVVNGGPVVRPKREVEKKLEALKGDNIPSKLDVHRVRHWREALEWYMGEENALCSVIEVKEEEA